MLLLTRELVNRQSPLYDELDKAELQSFVEQLLENALQHHYKPMSVSKLDAILERCHATGVATEILAQMNGKYQHKLNLSSVAVPEPLCIGCQRVASAIPEMCEHAEAEQLSTTALARQFGSYNDRNGHFACMKCYANMGAPSDRFSRLQQWIAP